MMNPPQNGAAAESRWNTAVSQERERKPQLYAKAGITRFWRVENVDERMVVYVYELDPATRACG
jgi:hypothetical protein